MTKITKEIREDSGFEHTDAFGRHYVQSGVNTRRAEPLTAEQEERAIQALIARRGKKWDMKTGSYIEL